MKQYYTCSGIPLSVLSGDTADSAFKMSEMVYPTKWDNLVRGRMERCNVEQCEGLLQGYRQIHGQYINTLIR